MSDSVLRLGIVGYGTQGAMYARMITDGQVQRTVLGAVCDVDAERRSAAGSLGCEVYEDVVALLESGSVDAVVTTVPHYLHGEVAIAAIERGVHVIVEKPLGVYVRQVKELLAVSDNHQDVALAVMFNQRANPLYSDLKALISSGEFGNLRHTNWIITNWWRPQAYYDQSAWRATWGGEGGGVLVNQAPHQLDLWQWLCGVPERVYAKVGYGFRRDIVVEDEVHALVDFGGGATGSLLTCTNDVIGTDRLEILFDSGKVVVEDSKTVTLTKLSASEQELSASMSVSDVADLFRGRSDKTRWQTVETKTYQSAWGRQHGDVLANFAAHVLDGSPLIAPGADGEHGVRLANAIHLSSWTGEEVTLAELDEDRYLHELNARIVREGLYPECS